MDTNNHAEWNGFGSFLRDIDLTDNEPQSNPGAEPIQVTSKYCLDGLQGDLRTLDDAIEAVNELRRFAKCGILITSR